jgi:hypothetical protein
VLEEFLEVAQEREEERGPKFHGKKEMNQISDLHGMVWDLWKK